MLRFRAKAIIILSYLLFKYFEHIVIHVAHPIQKNKTNKLQTILNPIKCSDFKFQFENNITIFKEFPVHKSFMCLNVIKRIYTIANRGDRSAFIKAKIMFNASRISHKIPLPQQGCGTDFFKLFISFERYRSRVCRFIHILTLCTRNWLYFDHKIECVCIPFYSPFSRLG